MKTLFTLVAFAVAGMVLRAAGSDAGFVPLFNGRDLSGWTVHGTEKWFAIDGELVCESGPERKYGYLSTKKDYLNFELKLEFWLEQNGNSGVFVRSAIDGLKIRGWQVEVAPPGRHTGAVYESYGRGWLERPKPEDEKILRPDGWNALRVRVVGDEVTTWLNGREMVRVKDAKIGEGRGFIALQIHDGEPIRVRWRGIAIRELP